MCVCVCACSALLKHKHGLASVYTVAVECKGLKKLADSGASACRELLKALALKPTAGMTVERDRNLNAGFLNHSLPHSKRRRGVDVLRAALGLVCLSILCLHI